MVHIDAVQAAQIRSKRLEKISVSCMLFLLRCLEQNALAPLQKILLSLRHKSKQCCSSFSAASGKQSLMYWKKGTGKSSAACTPKKLQLKNLAFNSTTQFCLIPFEFVFQMRENVL